MRSRDNTEHDIRIHGKRSRAFIAPSVGSPPRALRGCTRSRCLCPIRAAPAWHGDPEGCVSDAGAAQVLRSAQGSGRTLAVRALTQIGGLYAVEASILVNVFADSSANPTACNTCRSYLQTIAFTWLFVTHCVGRDCLSAVVAWNAGASNVNEWDHATTTTNYARERRSTGRL